MRNSGGEKGRIQGERWEENLGSLKWREGREGRRNWQKVGAERDYTVVYIEYQSVCPFVGIGSPTPSLRKRECLSLGPKEGGSNTRLGVRVAEGANSDDWTEILALCVLCG